MSQELQIDAQYVAGKLTQWAEKSGESIDSIKNRFQQIYAKTTGVSEPVKFRKALNTLKRSFETSMNSTALTYKVVILGAAAPFDAVKKRRSDLRDKWDKSKAEMIASGEARLQNDEPVFVDIKKSLPNGNENPFYGKPIPEHSWMTNCVGVAMKPTEDKKWFPANIVLRGEEFIREKIPIFREIELRVNGNFSTEQGRYNLNSSKGATKFDSLGKELSPNELTILVDAVYGNKFVLAGNLKENFEKTKGDFNRIVVTEGILNSKYKNETGLSNIVLGDETLDLSETVRGFIDGNIKEMLDKVEAGDTVTVIGRSSIGKGYDSVTKQKTDEDVLIMNVYSVFPRPE